MTTAQGAAFEEILTTPTRERVEIGQNEWAVVRAHYDMSGILGAYGPRPTRESAEDLAKLLADLGVGDQLTVVPFYSIH